MSVELEGPNMKALTVLNAVAATTLGSLFAAPQKEFSGLGSATFRTLKALPSSALLILTRDNTDKYSLRLSAANDVSDYQASISTQLAVGTALLLESTLPVGATRRFAWTGTSQAGGPGTVIEGPSASQVYSLEDFINILADGGFFDGFDADGHSPKAWAVGDHVVIDQASGNVYVVEDGEALGIEITANNPDPDVTLESESAKWE